MLCIDVNIKVLWWELKMNRICENNNRCKLNTTEHNQMAKLYCSFGALCTLRTLPDNSSKYNKRIELSYKVSELLHWHFVFVSFILWIVQILVRSAMQLYAYVAINSPMNESFRLKIYNGTRKSPECWAVCIQNS